MDDLRTIQQLISDVAEHLKAGTKADHASAIAKLRRVEALSSTLAFTIRSMKRG